MRKKKKKKKTKSTVVVQWYVVKYSVNFGGVKCTIDALSFKTQQSRWATRDDDDGEQPQQVNHTLWPTALASLPNITVARTEPKGRVRESDYILARGNQASFSRYHMNLSAKKIHRCPWYTQTTLFSLHTESIYLVIPSSGGEEQQIRHGANRFLYKHATYHTTVQYH